VGTSAIFILAAAAKKYMACMDVPCAFLNATREKDMPLVFMILEREVVKSLCELENGYSVYVRQNGTLIVLLTVGLYGCIESSHLWNKEATNTLLLLGFTVCDHDPCLFKKGDVIVALYVDDLMVTASNEEHIFELHRKLSDKYGKLKLRIGNQQRFLGMDLTFRRFRDSSYTSR